MHSTGVVSNELFSFYVLLNLSINKNKTGLQPVSRPVEKRYGFFRKVQKTVQTWGQKSKNIPKWVPELDPLAVLHLNNQLFIIHLKFNKLT